MAPCRQTSTLRRYALRRQLHHGMFRGMLDLSGVAERIGSHRLFPTVREGMNAFVREHGVTDARLTRSRGSPPEALKAPCATTGGAIVVQKLSLVKVVN